MTKAKRAEQVVNNMKDILDDDEARDLAADAVWARSGDGVAQPEQAGPSYAGQDDSEEEQEEVPQEWQPYVEDIHEYDSFMVPDGGNSKSKVDNYLDQAYNKGNGSAGLVTKIERKQTEIGELNTKAALVTPHYKVINDDLYPLLRKAYKGPVADRVPAVDEAMNKLNDFVQNTLMKEPNPEIRLAYGRVFESISEGVFTIPAQLQAAQANLEIMERAKEIAQERKDDERRAAKKRKDDEARAKRMAATPPSKLSGAEAKRLKSKK